MQAVLSGGTLYGTASSNLGVGCSETIFSLSSDDGTGSANLYSFTHGERRLCAVGRFNFIGRYAVWNSFAKGRRVRLYGTVFALNTNGNIFKILPHSPTAATAVFRW